MQMTALPDPFRDSLELTRLAAELRRFPGDVDLDEHFHRRRGMALKFLDEFDRINRVDHVEQLNGSLGLVALQMPDQMPPDCLLPAACCLLFFPGFLHAILPHIGHAKRDDLRDHVRGNRFRHADKRHGGGITVAALTGTLNALPHQRQTMT